MLLKPMSAFEHDSRRGAIDEGSPGPFTAAADFAESEAPPTTVFATHSGSLSDDEEYEVDVRTSNGPPELRPSVLLERKSVQDLLKTLATSRTGLFPWKSVMQARGEIAMPPRGAAGTPARDNVQHNDSTAGTQSFLEMLTSQLSSGLSLKPRGGRTTLRDNQAGPSTGGATAPAEPTAADASTAPLLMQQQQSPGPHNLATLDSTLLLPEMSALLGALVPSTGSATLPILTSLGCIENSGTPNLPGHKALATRMQQQQQHQVQSPWVPRPSGVSGAASDAAQPVHGSGGGAGPGALSAPAGGAGPHAGSVLSAMLRDGSMAQPLKMAWSLKDKVAACPAAAVPYLPVITAQESTVATHSRPSCRPSPFQVAPRGTGHGPHADPQQRDQCHHQQRSGAVHTSMPPSPPAELLIPSIRQRQDEPQLHPSALHHQHHQKHRQQQCHQHPPTQQPHSFETPASQPTTHTSNTSNAAPQFSAQAAFSTSAAAGAAPPWAGPAAAGPVGKRRRGPSRSGSAQPMSCDHAASGDADGALYDGSASEEDEEDENAAGAAGGKPAAAGAAVLLLPGSWTAAHGSLPGPVDVYVFGKKDQITVTGTFHPDRYLANQDCIWHQDQFVSRSRFEKEGGSTTAKWHCSIKIAGQRVSLGTWLQDHGLPVFKGAHRKSKQARANEAYHCNATPASTLTGQPAPAKPLDAPGRPGAAPLVPAFAPAVANAFGGAGPLVWCLGAGGPLGGSAVARGPHSHGTGVGVGVGSNRQQGLALGAQGSAASSAPGTQQQQQLLSMLRAGSFSHWGAAGEGGGSGGAAEGPTAQSLRSISFTAAPAALSQWAVGGSRAPQGHAQQQHYQQPVATGMDTTAVTICDEVGGDPAFVVPSRVVSTELAGPAPDAGHV